MNEDITPESFTEKILIFSKDQSLPLLKSLAHFCDYYNITPNKAAKLLTPKFLSLLAEEEGIIGLDFEK